MTSFATSHSLVTGSFLTPDSHITDVIKTDLFQGENIYGKDGDTVMTGTNGNDQMFGAPHGHETMYGEGGNDIMSASWDGSTMYGGAGHDTLLGASGNDTLFGGAGDDKIVGGAGVDHLYGGDGHNEFYFGASYKDTGTTFDTGDFTKGQADTIHDFTANDTIKLVGDYHDGGHTEAPAVGSYGISGSDGHFMVTYHTAEGFHDVLVEGADPTGHVTVADHF